MYYNYCFPCAVEYISIHVNFYHQHLSVASLKKKSFSYFRLLMVCSTYHQKCVINLKACHCL